MSTHENLSSIRLAAALFSVLLIGLLAGCAQTTALEPNIVQRAEGEKPAPPQPSGFLGKDYSLLQAGTPGSGQEAMLRYTPPNVDWNKYNKIMVLPVTFWADDDFKISAKKQQILCDYFFVTMVQSLSKDFTIVYGPGPGVTKLTIALSHATSATPGFRTVSIVSPQAHALNLLKMAATGTYAFVGSATAEAKLTDSETGELLEAWADQRFGTAAIRNATIWQWGDAENAMNYWADGLDQRLVSLGAGKFSTAVAASK
jgi:hypothetical protein